jgi:hypothetical protein
MSVRSGRAEAGIDKGGIMATWLWANIPLALLIFGCWTGIPLWLTLTRWHRETTAKHAEIAAMAAVEPVRPRQAMATAAGREAPVLTHAAAD